MKKLPYSVILSVAFLVSFTAQASTLDKPVYQLDTTHSFKSDAVASGVTNKAESKNASIVKLGGSNKLILKNINLSNDTGTHKPKIIVFSKCGASRHSAANSITGVSGGDPIGIRRPS